MSRSKPSRVTRIVSVPTSDDVHVDTAVVGVDASDAVTEPPVAPVAEEVAVQLTEPAEEHVEKKATKDEPKKVTAKAARRAKTCDKCIARREREREYARIARSKSRSLKETKKAAAAAEPAPPVPATTPEAEGVVEGRLNGGLD